MQVHSYLSFEGRCDEALEFYRNALGAEVTSLSRFKEAPDQSMMAPDSGEKVMHATLRVGETTLMASDGRCSGQLRFEGISLTILPEDEAAAERIFTALSNGGEVQMPLSETFFARSFGMVADRFGVPWMLYLAR